ncbi:MAG: hypothetical protein M1838_001169 [Thelocarpon superellum]|nr:MAG: hypothetical protein M1838_001169 [Thelocarpon superellum]
MDKIVVNGFSIEHARAQFDRLKTADQTRGELLDQLIREVERLTQKYDDVESRLEREQTTSSTYHQRSRDLQLELDKTGREMVHLQTRNAFVLVLIDGDGVNFKDTVLHSGGNTAANQLRKSTQEYVSQMRPDVPDFEIIIRIYVNLKGLARTYRDLEQPADFEQFVQEFNMAHPLGEIINAGHGKECADEKIKCEFFFVVELRRSD